MDMQQIARVDTKIVLRRLPPDISEKDFLQAIAAFAPTTDYCTFYPGKLKRSKTVPSFAVINFRTHESMINFAREFDCFPFTDKYGRSYPAVVELSPFAYVPTQDASLELLSRKSLAQSAEVQSFCSSLDKQNDAIQSNRGMANIKPIATGKTPLVELLHQKITGRKKEKSSLAKGTTRQKLTTTVNGDKNASKKKTNKDKKPASTSSKSSKVKAKSSSKKINKREKLSTKTSQISPVIILKKDTVPDGSSDVTPQKDALKTTSLRKPKSYAESSPVNKSTKKILSKTSKKTIPKDDAPTTSVPAKPKSPKTIVASKTPSDSSKRVVFITTT